MDNHHAQYVSFEESGHVQYVCSDEKKQSDSHNYCQFCEGGLFACTRCGSFEGATTTHCPGERMSYEVADAVYAGHKDFRNGEWVIDGSPHTPNRGWDLYPEPPKE
jgi:hypothetical protein